MGSGNPNPFAGVSQFGRRCPHVGGNAAKGGGKGGEQGVCRRSDIFVLGHQCASRKNR